MLQLLHLYSKTNSVLFFIMQCYLQIKPDANRKCGIFYAEKFIIPEQTFIIFDSPLIIGKFQFRFEMHMERCQSG
jgi:hypothetical protein